MPVLSLQAIETLCLESLLAVGASEEQAAIVAAEIDRGLRGIEFTDDELWIAASDELFCYTPDFQLVGSYRNPYLRHCHEISRRDRSCIDLHKNAPSIHWLF